jgi:hypothetical protein
MDEKRKFLVWLPLLLVVCFGFWWFLANQENEQVQSKEAAPSSQPQPSITSEDIQQSEEVAKKFLESYLDYDGNQPTNNIEQARPWMTDALYREQLESIVRPTEEIQSTRLVTIESSQHEVQTPNIQWTMVIIEEVANRKGDKRREEWTYDLTLTKENDWKVEEVDVRGSVE